MTDVRCQMEFSPLPFNVISPGTIAHLSWDAAAAGEAKITRLIAERAPCSPLFTFYSRPFIWKTHLRRHKRITLFIIKGRRPRWNKLRVVGFLSLTHSCGNFSLSTKRRRLIHLSLLCLWAESQRNKYLVRISRLLRRLLFSARQKRLWSLDVLCTERWRKRVLW